MKKSLWRRWRDLSRAEFLSPKDMVQRAAIFCVAFAIAHLLGLREYTSIINGTTGSVEMTFEQAAARGITYLVLYMLVILLVPILLIAAGISLVWLKKSSHESSNHPPKAD